MTTPGIQELLQARADGPDALRELAEQHLPLVGALVRRFHGPGPKEELYQQGVIGLMKAMHSFDPERGTAFSTYAAAMIIGEMRMLRRLDAPLHMPRGETALRRRIRQSEAALAGRLHRVPTITELADALHMDAAELTLHMDAVTLCSADAETPSGTTRIHQLPDPEDWQTRVELRDILSQLPQRDQRLLLLRHRFGMTQQQAGIRLGMTQMQVSRREKVIRSMLRAALAE